MIENVNIDVTNLPQSLNKVSKNKICFRGNDDNKLERIPQNDIAHISDKKDHTVRNVVIGAIIATGLAIAGDFIFAKGKHVKNLIGKGEKVAEKDSKKLISKGEKVAEKDSKKLTENIGNAAKKEEGYIDKGSYGQDLHDPFNPANKLDPLSPHYEGNSYNKGIYGQDLYDPAHPMNKYDASSPYFDSGIGGGYGSMGGYGSGYGSGLGGDGFGGGYGSGFGY